MKEAEDDKFLHSKQRDAKQGHHQQLDRAYFSQEGTIGDQRASTAEVCIDQTVEAHILKEENMIKMSGNFIAMNEAWNPCEESKQLFAQGPSMT